MLARILTLFGLILGTNGGAADPPSSVSHRELDKIAVEVLREVHDRGADLYNAADAAGAQKMYEGALRTVSPFLAHHPKIRTTIEDGWIEIAKLKGAKEQAFRLHEIIEQVRADLKTAIKKAEEENKPVTYGKLTGTATYNGAPLSGCSITVVSLDLPYPRVFTATTDATGKFAYPEPLPTGNYAVMVTDTGAVKLPAAYQSTMTSGLTLRVVEGSGNQADLKLQSK
jgi:hypothetical protein